MRTPKYLWVLTLVLFLAAAFAGLTVIGCSISPTGQEQMCGFNNTNAAFFIAAIIFLIATIILFIKRKK